MLCMVFNRNKKIITILVFLVFIFIYHTQKSFQPLHMIDILYLWIGIITVGTLAILLIPTE